MPRRLISAGLTLLLAVLACGLPSGAAPTPTPAPRVAQLSEISNDVRARDNRAKEWETAGEGQVIGVTGGVRTGDQASARVDTSEGSILRLAANTQFELLEFPPGSEDPVTRLRLEAGKLWIVVTQQLGAGSFEVETPTGVATVRGSMMSLEQSGGGALVVTCLEGACRLANPDSGAAVDLQAGQQSGMAAAGQDPAPPAPMTADQYQDWLQNVPEAFNAAQSLLSQITPAPPAGDSLGAGPGGNESSPRLVFDGRGMLHLVWESRSRRPGGDYFHRLRNADGTWSQPENLTEDFQYLYGSLALLRRPDGAPCALWNGARTGTADIGLYQRCRVDGVWSEAAFVEVRGVTSRDFDFAFAPEGALRAAFLTGAGTISFDPRDLNQADPPQEPLQLSDQNLSLRPAFEIDAGGGFHVAWVRLGSAGSDPAAASYRFSSDQGVTWSEAAPLTEPEAGLDSLSLRLAADPAGDIHALVRGAALVYRRWSPGAGWGPAAALTDQSFNGFSLQIAFGPDGQPQVIWANTQGLWLTRRQADGTWTTPESVIATSGYTGETAFAIDAQGVRHIVRPEPRAADAGQTDLVYVALP